MEAHTCDPIDPIETESGKRSRLDLLTVSREIETFYPAGEAPDAGS